MALFTLGVSHKTAPIDIREKLAFSTHQISHALISLVNSTQTVEAALISTCNRTELYCKMSNPDEVLKWWQHYHCLKQEEINPYIYTFL